jgi:uroporphyrinogen decarboxylase
MATYEGLTGNTYEPNFQGLIDNIARKGTPDRCYHLELFHDAELREAIIKRFELDKDLNASDPYFERWRLIAFQRFLGFDYVTAYTTGMHWPVHDMATEDLTEGDLAKGKRWFVDESKGPITNWEEFEKYPWPDPNEPGATEPLEWFQENLPEDMCIVLGEIGHYSEFLNWLMGYETLCLSLYDQRDLVEAIRDRVMDFYRVLMPRLVDFDRIKIFFPSDDMGFKNGTFLSPADMREFVLPGHKEIAKIAHDTGRLSILHACGNLEGIMDDLIHDVKIDGKHSFEDTIEDVRQVKDTYGQEIAILGGMDVDFLCRADEAAIRQRVRDTLDKCLPGGGYCLGTGNTPANYIPVDNYLAMVDEGRLYAR